MSLFRCLRKVMMLRMCFPKVNRVSLGFLLDKLGLENSITPKFITANQIVQYVRAMQNTVGSNVESFDQAEWMTR